MDATGGCCTARFTAGGSYMDRIMLRFRPIAPKPTAGTSVSPPANGAHGLAKTGRGKRRYARKSINKNNSTTNRKRKASSSSGSGSGSWSGSSETVVTLPLLPDTPVNMGELCFVKDTAAPSVSVGGRRRVESWVTVETVTEAWVHGKGLGSTDEETRMNLERDTCPGFESDGVGRVRWTNKAYRKLVGQGEYERNEEVNMMVCLVIKAGLMTHSPAFTCTARMRYTCRNEMTSMTVPCDVWRMDGGGFAWRLDVKAALTLSLPL